MTGYRRRVLRIAAILTVLSGLATVAISAGESPYSERRWAVMGTYAEAKISAKRKKRAERALEAVDRAIAESDRVLSNWSADSHLSRLNAKATEGAAPVEHPVLRSCLDTAFRVAEISDGAFDPTVGPLVRIWGFRPRDPRIPSEEEIMVALASTGWVKVDRGARGETVRFPVEGMELDLGGIGKGCALDLAREYALEEKAEAGLLDLGGNLLIFGEPPAGGKWKVGVRDPERKGALGARLDIGEGVVATSGQYENKAVVRGRTVGHILDARSGHPVDSDVLSATAIADSGALADAASTALLAAGSRHAEEMLARLDGVEAILVVRRGKKTEVLASRSLSGRLTLQDALFDRAGGEIRFVLPPSESVYDSAEKAFRELGR